MSVWIPIVDVAVGVIADVTVGVSGIRISVVAKLGDGKVGDDVGDDVDDDEAVDLVEGAADDVAGVDDDVDDDDVTPLSGSAIVLATNTVPLRFDFCCFLMIRVTAPASIRLSGSGVFLSRNSRLFFCVLILFPDLTTGVVLPGSVGVFL